MKIYSKLVISIDSGEVLEEESFEYSGPVAWCGKGGGGGGGTSGKVGWPQYLEDAQEEALNRVQALIDNSETINPYSALAAYIPDDVISNMGTAIAAFEQAVNDFDPDANWASLIDDVTSKFDSVVYDDSAIEADVQAQGEILSAEITANVLPRFRAGMRTVNAVISSAFVIGEANIEAERVRGLAKYGSEIKVKYRLQRAEAIVQTVGMLMQLNQHDLDGHKNLLHYRLEADRMEIVAKKEQMDTNIEILKKHGRWSLEEYQYLANLMAGPSGGTIGDAERPSSFQSALGGALSGASAGYMIGGPWGAAGGALLGLGASLF